MAKHDLGDMEALRATLQDWLRANLPDAAALELLELKFPEESGESSVSLILKVSHNGSETGMVCRMKPPASEVFAEHDLPLQYNLMAMAAENDIPVPPLLGFEGDESLVGSDFYIMGFVEGQVPTDNPPYCFGSWVTELSEDERRTMWRNGLEIVAKIHQIDLERYDVSAIPAPAPDASPAQHEIDKFESMFDEAIRARVPAVLVEAVQYIHDHAPQDGPRRLCWGDCRPGNVIWKNLKPNAIIDWEMASIGDPLQDVAGWFWIDYVNSVGLGMERLSGLPTTEELYSAWHDLSGLPSEHSDYYDLFCLVRYAIIQEKKLVAMEKAGLDNIGNFAVPIMEQKLRECQAGAKVA